MRKIKSKQVLAAAAACLMAFAGSGAAAASETDTEQPAAVHTAEIEAAEGGQLSFQGSAETVLFLSEGEDVYLVSRPEEGYELEMVCVSDANGLPVETVQKEEVFHLVMPAEDIRIRASFVPEKPVPEGDTELLFEEKAGEKAGRDADDEKTDGDAPEEKTDGDAAVEPEMPSGAFWVPVSREKVDAMAGAVSVSRRLLLRAGGSSMVHTGSMYRFYGAAAPSLYDDSGNLIYCILPWSSAPDGVAVQFNDYGISSGSDGNLQKMAKAMYYGYGGGGNILGGYSAQEQEAVTHFALSYIWMMEMGNTHGLADWTRTGGSYLDGTGQALVLDFLNQIQGKPAVTGTLRIASFYEASGCMYQDLACGSFVPEVREGQLELSKSSSCPEITKDNRCYSLEGAVYGVYSDPGCTSEAGRFVTGADGRSAQSLTLPEGIYYVKEISAPKGYLKDSAVYTAEVKGGAAANVNVSDTPGNDPVDLILVKRDAETGKAQAGLSLAGAQYTVRYYDADYEEDPAGTDAVPVKTWIFETDSDGQIALDEAHLAGGDSLYTVHGAAVFPLGTFTIRETGAPEGYLADETVYVIRTALQGGSSVVTTNLPNTEEQASGEHPVRGDLQFKKTDADRNQPMPGVPFSITSTATGETHTIISDGNGMVSTKGSGIWFGGGKPDPSKGALLYGTYKVEELPCAANYGKDPVSFSVTIDKNSPLPELPTVYNKDILIHTSAKEAGTGTKTVPAGASAEIRDTVHYENLTKGRTYTLKGTVMEKATGEPLVINGKTAETEKSFTASSAAGEEELAFRLDTSALEGKTLVIFEELYWKDTKIADHSDLSDEEQTVYVPSVHTAAEDAGTKDRAGTPKPDAVIRDTVFYTGLTIGKTYHLKGTVMDTDSGEPVMEDGKAVTAEMDFVPEAADGSVVLEVRLDASVLAGKSIVMFEEVTFRGSPVAVHADIADEEQMVHYPEIRTSAADAATEDGVGTVGAEAEIVDTVSCKNLAVGKEYTIKGMLMNKETGEPVLEDGKPVTAEKSFIAEKKNESVRLSFFFDSGSLSGKTVVVFENLYHNDVLLAGHSDPEDDGQSVRIPALHTDAADRNTETHSGTVSDKAVVTDTVNWKNLIPGRRYTVKGLLMVKETNEPLLVNGKTVDAETVFTAEKADGTVKLVYELDSSALAGKTVVVFEDLYYKNVKICSHADITDEEQSIHYPAIRTSASAGGSKTAEAGREIVLTDTVAYENLIPGSRYTVKGLLMEKAGGKALLVNGKEVTASADFIPETKDGTAEVVFRFRTDESGDMDIVVFEKLFLDQAEIASHEDLGDENQTVHLRKPVTAAKTSAKSAPKTGDSAGLLPPAAALTAAAFGIAVLSVKRRKNR